MTESQTTNPQLATVRQFCERHPFMTEGGVRHLIFHAESNGFSRCIRRIGRRVYIDETAFFIWMESQPENARHA